MTTTSPVVAPDPVVAVCDTHAAAEDAIRALSMAGFDMKKLSIVGKGYHSEEHAVGFYTAGERIRTWGGIGSFWGAIWGLLAGPAIFFIPSVGLVAAGGPFGMALVAALEGAVLVGGLTALGAALSSLGLGDKKVIKYEADIKADRFLVIVHGGTDDIAHARALLAGAAQPSRTADRDAS
ncbi:MAG TPA: general stress protein [Variovorax sp.]